ncbi:hypothetical protein FRUB_01352 [Fimbriiglobus ruber]|uniref:Uncharacterized protein n=1 Tax=Fimbriiglobus ruber TaxID=1908690 RepID=A0A225DUL7_9BACT|nr:hypothetical protein FRUB_01352 [Fimbriiglobus ruber]
MSHKPTAGKVAALAHRRSSRLGGKGVRAGKVRTVRVS